MKKLAKKEKNQGLDPADRWHGKTPSNGNSVIFSRCTDAFLSSPGNPKLVA